MPTFMLRALVNGKMIGHPVDAETEEEAKAKFQEVLPLLAEQAEDAARGETPLPSLPPGSPRPPPVKNPALDGQKFLSLEFQCSACGALLAATFKDGYLQIDPCPTCLGELESMVAASKRFLERKNVRTD
jgi:phage FluMu protein Com